MQTGSYGLAHVNKINSRSRDLPGGSNLQGGGGGVDLKIVRDNLIVYADLSGDYSCRLAPVHKTIFHQCVIS